MYLPMDPRGETRFWDHLEEYLKNNNYYLIVHDGIYNSSTEQVKLSDYEIALELSKMQKYNYKRIGMHHNSAYAPHYAIQIDHNIKNAKLMEYISDWNDLKSFENEITIMSDILFMENRNLISFQVPFILELKEPLLNVEINKDANITTISPNDKFIEHFSK